MRNANLSHAGLVCAELKSAGLSDADLTGASFTCNPKIIHFNKTGVFTNPLPVRGVPMKVSQFTENKRVKAAIGALQNHWKTTNKKVSDIVDDDNNQYVDLVMEGGGVLGIALVGYTYALESVGIRFLGVGGTSAGAINAMLVVAVDEPAKAKRYCRFWPI